MRSLLQQAGLHGAYGGIKIDMAKGARFLDSAHLLFDESGGFSAMMKMFQHDPSKTLLSRSFGGVKDWTTRAPMLALTTPDPALGFPTGTTLQPKLFIHNAAAKPFTAHIYFNWRSAAAAGKTAPLALPFKPNETQVLDVAALQAQKLLPSDAYWATVILSAPVLPEELLAVAASYDQTGRYGTQTPFNDQLASHWEAGAWQVDGTHNSLVTISNGGNKPAIAQLTIFYNHGAGQYQLERPLAPDEQMALDFGKLIHDQVPDKNGNTLPHDLAWGTYRIRDLADEAAGSLYEGKVILDKTYGHATYGCMICCGPQSPRMQFSPLSVPVSGFQNQQVQALNSCTSKLTTITGDFPTWWTDNTSIATATRSQINGIAVGATNHNAQSIMMYWGPKEDSGGEPCPQDQQDTSAGTNVMPQIMFNGQNITGTTQSVVVGQQIALTAAYGNTIPNSQAWTVPGTIVGGFSHSSTNGGPNPINLNGQSTTFYWVTAGTSGTLTANVTFTLNYGNNQTATASSTFTVSGVTSPLVGTSLGNWQIGAGPILEFGDPANTPGITFTKSAVPPTGFPGAYEWVQLVTTSSYSCKYTQANPVNESTPALDTSYPYSTSPSTTDSPQVGLPSSDVEVTWNLAATMYLMWRPGLSNDIYVPLGYVTWQGFGDATQTGGTWSVVQSNSTRNANSFIQSSSYPQWTLTLGQITPCP